MPRRKRRCGNGHVFHTIEIVVVGKQVMNEEKRKEEDRKLLTLVSEGKRESDLAKLYGVTPRALLKRVSEAKRRLKVKEKKE